MKGEGVDSANVEEDSDLLNEMCTMNVVKCDCRSQGLSHTKNGCDVRSQCCLLHSLLWPIDQSCC